MLRTIYRVLFLLFVVAGCLRLSAQVVSGAPASPAMQSDVALWTVGSFVADTQLTDEEGDYLDIFFEEEPGFGVSVNHYWTGHFSTEVSLMTFRADLSVGSALIQEPVRIGELDGRAVTAMAQWHFRQGARVMPYLAGGIAHIDGTFDPVDDEETDGSIDLQSNVTWTAAAGLDIRLTDHFLLCLEAKRVPWNAVEEGGSVQDAIDIDPMLYGSGVRFRF